jgi:hypothetical protein
VHLPRQHVEVDVADTDKSCDCGTLMMRIGDLQVDTAARGRPS